MNSSELKDAVLAAAGEQGAASFAESLDNGERLKKRIRNLLGRVAYHGIVGLFLALIPVLYAGSAHLFPPSRSGVILLAVWIMLGAAYVYWRVGSEGAAKGKKTGLGFGWGPFLRESPNFILPGCFLGVFVPLIFDRFAAAYVICGGLLGVAIQVRIYKRILRNNEMQKEKNEQEIEKWVTSGDEEERSRRRAYVQSGALLIGAAAAGVAEYEGAPRLRWPSTPSFASCSCDDDDSAWHEKPVSSGSTDHIFSANSSSTYYNPATGLPTIDDTLGGMDVGGNLWGHNSFE